MHAEASSHEKFYVDVCLFVSAVIMKKKDTVSRMASSKGASTPHMTRRAKSSGLVMPAVSRPSKEGVDH